MSAICILFGLHGCSTVTSTLKESSPTSSVSYTVSSVADSIQSNFDKVKDFSSTYTSVMTGISLYTETGMYRTKGDSTRIDSNGDYPTTTLLTDKGQYRYSPSLNEDYASTGNQVYATFQSLPAFIRAFGTTVSDNGTFLFIPIDTSVGRISSHIEFKIDKKTFLIDEYKATGLFSNSEGIYSESVSTTISYVAINNLWVLDTKTVKVETSVISGNESTLGVSSFFNYEETTQFSNQKVNTNLSDTLFDPNTYKLTVAISSVSSFFLDRKAATASDSARKPTQIEALNSLFLLKLLREKRHK